jgi:hypothetical protein
MYELNQELSLTKCPQLLGSAYALGAGMDQLTRSYENEISQLIPVSRGFIRGNAISKENWRKFLDQKESVEPQLS